MKPKERVVPVVISPPLPESSSHEGSAHNSDALDGISKGKPPLSPQDSKSPRGARSIGRHPRLGPSRLPPISGSSLSPHPTPRKLSLASTASAASSAGVSVSSVDVESLAKSVVASCIAAELDSTTSSSEDVDASDAAGFEDSVGLPQPVEESDSSELAGVVVAATVAPAMEAFSRPYGHFRPATSADYVHISVGTAGLLRVAGWMACLWATALACAAAYFALYCARFYSYDRHMLFRRRFSTAPFVPFVIIVDIGLFFGLWAMTAYIAEKRLKWVGAMCVGVGMAVGVFELAASNTQCCEGYSELPSEIGMVACACACSYATAQSLRPLSSSPKEEQLEDKRRYRLLLRKRPPAVLLLIAITLLPILTALGIVYGLDNVYKRQGERTRTILGIVFVNGAGWLAGVLVRVSAFKIVEAHPGSRWCLQFGFRMIVLLTSRFLIAETGDWTLQLQLSIAYAVWTLFSRMMTRKYMEVWYFVRHGRQAPDDWFHSSPTRLRQLCDEIILEDFLEPFVLFFSTLVYGLVIVSCYGRSAQEVVLSGLGYLIINAAVLLCVDITSGWWLENKLRLPICEVLASKRFRDAVDFFLVAFAAAFPTIWITGHLIWVVVIEEGSLGE